MKNRNKYSQLIPKEKKESIKNPDIPFHLIEFITNYSDIKTKALLSLTCKQLKTYIGDIRPIYFINQKYFIEIITKICNDEKYDFFNFSIISKDYHLIIAEEENRIVKITFINRENRLKTIKRSYSKSFVTKSFINLFKCTRIFYGTDQIAKDFFIELFNNVSNISLSCNEYPNDIYDWKIYLKSINMLNSRACRKISFDLFHL